MQKFSEFISEYLKKNNISYRSAESMCKISRAGIKRYAEGERIPDSYEIVQQLVDGLGFDQEEKEKIKYSYLIEKMGKRKYEMFAYMEYLFLGRNVYYEIRDDFFYQLLEIEPEETSFWNMEEVALQRADEKGVCHFSDREEIRQVMKSLIFGAKEIKLYQTPINREVMKLLCQKVKKDPECEVLQIFKSTNSMDEDDVYNIQNIRAVFPVFLQTEKYEIYHYYKGSGRWDEDKLKQGILWTPKGVLLCDFYLTSGVFLSRPEYINYYRIMLERMRLGIIKLAERVPNNQIDQMVGPESESYAGDDGKNTFFFPDLQKLCIKNGGTTGSVIYEPALIHRFRDYMQNRD